MRSYLAPLVASATLMAGVDAVSAATFYDSEAAYSAATTTAVTDDFETYGQVFGTTTLNLNEFTATEDPGVPGVGIFNRSSVFGFGVTSGDWALIYDDNGDSIVTFDAFSGAYEAMGFFISASENSTVMIGGSVSTTLDLIANTPEFFGVVAMAPITSLTFDVSGGPNVVFDEFRAGGTAAVIPLPAPALLLGSALGLVAVFRRRV